MTKRYLNYAYNHGRGEEAVAFYDSWATTYDDELTSGNYQTPARCAAALANAMDDITLPVLDFGCGTGLSGKALAAAGFTTIDGWDPSPKMLARAERRNEYRVLRQIDPDRPLFAPENTYAGVNAAGVLSPGLAPPETFDQLLDFLPIGGCIAFSLNDHAIENGEHEEHLDDLFKRGIVRLTFREYGEHIPGTGLKAWVFVITKR